MRTAANALLTRQSVLGVGLLEVLVSFALMAGVGLAVLSWFQQNTTSATRLREFYDRQSAREHALAVVQTINPMVSTKGTSHWRGWRIDWQCEPLTPEVPQAGYPSGEGSHTLALYQVQIKGYKDSERLDFEEVTQAVGHRYSGATAPSLLLRQ